MAIPKSAKAHIIGSRGSTIKALQESSGARIQLPKIEEGQAAEDEDEDDMIDVLIEGNAYSAAAARDAILKIAGERAANVSTRLKNVPAEFYPFIAGPKNDFINRLEEDNGVHIRVPPTQARASQYPQPPAAGERPVFFPPQNENFIHLAGERAAVQASRAEIERRAEELRRQLTIQQLPIPRGRHQFIIGDQGVPMDQFFEDTGCSIVLPNAEDDDTVTVIGYPDRVNVGLDRAMDLAMGMQSVNVDIARMHRQAPGGARAHACNVTRYLRQRNVLGSLEQQHAVHFNTPLEDNEALPWEIYSRDGKSIIRAQSEIKGLVDAHPPARMATVPVDPFFYNYIRSEVQPRVRQDYRVQLVLPEASDNRLPILLVYEGPASPSSYEVPRSQPSQAEIREMQQFLQQASNHLQDLINKQEAVTSETLEVPQKYDKTSGCQQ